MSDNILRNEQSNTQMKAVFFSQFAGLQRDIATKNRAKKRQIQSLLAPFNILGYLSTAQQQPQSLDKFEAINAFHSDFVYYIPFARTLFHLDSLYCCLNYRAFRAVGFEHDKMKRRVSGIYICVLMRTKVTLWGHTMFADLYGKWKTYR